MAVPTLEELGMASFRTTLTTFLKCDIVSSIFRFHGAVALKDGNDAQRERATILGEHPEGFRAIRARRVNQATVTEKEPLAKRSTQEKLRSFGRASTTLPGKIPPYVRDLLLRNREFILGEVVEVQGLMRLLMKHRNTGKRWTGDELREIRKHLKEISKIVPLVVIFLLPGGTILLPFLAEVLDRRKAPRDAPLSSPKETHPEKESA